jgi:hypothetical protein
VDFVGRRLLVVPSRNVALIIPNLAIPIGAARASGDSISALKRRALTSRVVARCDVLATTRRIRHEKGKIVSERRTVPSSFVSYVCARGSFGKGRSLLDYLFYSPQVTHRRGLSIACVIEHMLAAVRPLCVPCVRVYSQFVRCEHTRCACVTHRVNIWYK